MRLFSIVSLPVLVSRVLHTTGSGHLSNSYRSSSVISGSTSSSTLSSSCGVLQGSVFGPILFIIYVSPIASIISSHGTINMLMIHSFFFTTSIHSNPSAPVYLPKSSHSTHDNTVLFNCLSRSSACWLLDFYLLPHLRS